jgi:hypothetical protein
MPQVESSIRLRKTESKSIDDYGEEVAVFTGHSRAESRTSADFKDPRLELVERIAGSRHFRKSSRLSHFLLYVVQREIDGRNNEISEQQIGVHVFGRSATYNPGDDNIVRAYARNLRSRLEEYYRGDGKDDRLLIEIPRGAYRPVFIDRQTEQPVTDDAVRWPEVADDPSAIPCEEEPVHRTTSVAELPLQPLPERPWHRPYLFVTAALMAFAFMIAAYQAGQRNFVRLFFHQDHAFWETMFNSKQDTLIVPGDSSLVLLEGITHQPVTPDEYERKIYDTDVQSKLGDQAALIANLAQRPYTSIVDLQATNRFDSLPEVVPERTHIRFARDLHVEDLKSDNVILLGSSQANPWVQLFDNRLPLHISYRPSDGGYRIWNAHPEAGEQAEYPFSLDDSEHRAYALVAYMPNLSARGHVLLIEGTSMAGTQAALDLLFNNASMQSLLTRARMPDGTLGSFEVLLQTTDVGSRSAGASILAERLPLAVTANQ